MNYALISYFCCWKYRQVSTATKILEKPGSNLCWQFCCTRRGVRKSNLQWPHVRNARW